ncbi:MAG: hypothetical protein HKN87_01265 [Saprospiraceae bacterium]|nr:hypothetical protein [Saprospiraceae bacterium]
MGKLNLYILSVLVILVSSFLISCHSHKRNVQRTLDERIQSNGLFNDHLYGIQIYDPEVDKEIYAFNAHKLFIPASNIKILTLYTAMKTLGDSLISHTYKTIENHHYIWGMADPTTLHPKFEDQPNSLRILPDSPEGLTFCQNHVFFKPLGPGWAWDDYTYAYQTERSSFPLYANQMWYTKAKDSTRLLDFFPRAFNHTISLDSVLRYMRTPQSNKFEISLPPEESDDFALNIPMHMSEHAFRTLLNQITSHEVKISHQCPDQTGANAVFSTRAVEAYQIMMQDSDNFMAEQLLLMCAGATFGNLYPKEIINHMQNEYLDQIKDEIQWVDGSGLSRYNLISPAALVTVLSQLLKEMSWEEIKLIFAAGGQSGTLRHWYKNIDGAEPYIYAKTGTLSGSHCLSGYLKTDQGKTLIFSFMHNNYLGSSSIVKRKMEGLLHFVKSNY